MSAESPSLPLLPPRPLDAHKGLFGRVLLVGGSQGMAGAIALAGMASLRSGAGLVTLAVPRGSLSVVAGFDPAYMTIPLEEDARGRVAASARRRLERLRTWATVVACGPGLGRSVELSRLVAWMYMEWTQPLIIDADGLNALAARRALDRPHAGPRILTPHVGEFRRLVELPERADRGTLEAAAAALAQRAQVVVVLKGAGSLITDGARRVHNTTGNPGLAKGGTGDVLTGVIAALVGQGLSLFDAAQLGCHLHGRAGDQAAASIGQLGMTARDVIAALPHVIAEHYVP